MTIATVDATTAERRTLDAFFSHSLRTHPSRPALFVSGRYWTYAELDAQCRAIEDTLSTADLTNTCHNIGLLYAGAALSYAAVIAVMRSNNVHVPLNRKTPAERLLRILEDAGIEAVIVDASEALPDSVLKALLQSRPLHLFVKGPFTTELESALQVAPQHRIWRIGDTVAANGLHNTPPNPADPPDSASLAYIIYTSGSTGVPKGVAITHESSCRCIEKLHLMFQTEEQDRFTQFSAMSFDVSIADLFLCWKSGATLYVPAPEEALVPLNFAVKHQLTIWASVPSLASFLLKLQLLKRAALPKLRLTLFAGEALPTELAQAWAVAAPNSKVFNIYGPTECTIYSIYYEYDSRTAPQQAVVPIGIPLPGLRSMVVDDGHPIEQDNTPGELWLSGDQLAYGYWKNPAATRTAFVHYPANGPSSAMWYRTGDVVSWQAGVGLSFRGRIDRQVKLRGYRIELQEIESALRDVVGCTLAAVVPLRNAGGLCEEIVAYCDRLSGDEATIKARCLDRLPRYMVPDRIFELDPIPLSDHGKVDYQALAARTARRSA